MPQSGGGLAATTFLVPLRTTVRVLGIDLDWQLSLDGHFAILKKAQIRQGILSRVARCSLGLEWGVLEMTHDAVITSLRKNALSVTGSCLPTDLFRKVDSMIANVAARKVGGISRTVRIESIRLLSGTMSMSNLFAIHCAGLLDSSLRAVGSDIRERLTDELCGYLGVDTLGVTVTRITIPRRRIHPIRGVNIPPVIWDRTVWART